MVLLNAYIFNCLECYSVKNNAKITYRFATQLTPTWSVLLLVSYAIQALSSPACSLNLHLKLPEVLTLLMLQRNIVYSHIAILMMIHKIRHKVHLFQEK